MASTTLYGWWSWCRRCVHMDVRWWPLWPPLPLMNARCCRVNDSGEFRLFLLQRVEGCVVLLFYRLNRSLKTMYLRLNALQHLGIGF